MSSLFRSGAQRVFRRRFSRSSRTSSDTLTVNGSSVVAVVMASLWVCWRLRGEFHFQARLNELLDVPTPVDLDEVSVVVAVSAHGLESRVVVRGNRFAFRSNQHVGHRHAG